MPKICMAVGCTNEAATTLNVRVLEGRNVDIQVCPDCVSKFPGAKKVDRQGGRPGDPDATFEGRLQIGHAFSG